MDATPDPLYEQLASIQHTIWSHWMRYLLGDCVEVHDDGSCTLSVDRVNAWWRQIDTPYAQLTEREKDSDREQVDRLWPLIQARDTSATEPDPAGRDERDARRRGKVYAALHNEPVIRTGPLGGLRALDAPEMERIAAIAVAALRKDLT